MKNEKTLLQEGSVRRFMKLASLQPLTEEFVQNMYEEEEEEFPLKPYETATTLVLVTWGPT